MVLDSNIYDISSSDDEEEDHSLDRNGSTGSAGLSPDFPKVFNMDAEEDDDVVIIDKPTVTSSVKRDKPRPMRFVDDDDCRILDTDPGATDITDIDPPLDSDELVMTGEKGPVACRDFAHARYQCVRYPFKTTLHSKFCAQCHCYVCDSLAPCTQWGDGSGSNDHCHATEESRWKTLRKLAKYGPVPSLAIPTTVVSAAPTPPLSNLSDYGNFTAAGRFLPSAVSLNTSSMTSLDTSSTLPINQAAVSQSPVSHPVGSRVPRQDHGISTTVKKDPLIIKLKPKARGKPSQPPHLGVRSPRHHSGNRSALPSPRTSPRTAPAPFSRTRDEIPPAGVQPPHFPQFASYPNPGPGRAGSGTVAGMPQHHSQSVPAFKTVPGREGGVAVMAPHVQFSLPNVAPYFSTPAPPLPSNPAPVHFSRTTVNSNAVPSYYPASAPPLPNSPPPYIPPPPSNAYNYSAPGAYDFPPPGVFDHNSARLPGTDATPVPHIPDSRYVSASALSTQQVNCNVNTATFYEGHSGAQPYDYLAQGYRSPVDSAHYPSSSYISSNGGNADILVGATEGWVEDATAHFDSFGNGILGTAPDHDHQAASSLNDVLEQMAGDDYLWEQFPCW
ncbi:hypothetical protein M758_3G138900 [Ceratodon purpureus]|nr:hypothetical protein M758_3G138900 [Ceratodon purpureus]